MAMSENMSLFFNANQFADVGTLASGGTLTGIFDDTPALASGGLGMDTSSLVFTIPETDFHDDLIGEVITLKNRRYVIEQRGQGKENGAALILSLA